MSYIILHLVVLNQYTSRTKLPFISITIITSSTFDVLSSLLAISDCTSPPALSIEPYAKTNCSKQTPLNHSSWCILELQKHDLATHNDHFTEPKQLHKPTSHNHRLPWDHHIFILDTLARFFLSFFQHCTNFCESNKTKTIYPLPQTKEILYTTDFQIFYAQRHSELFEVIIHQLWREGAHPSLEVASLERSLSSSAEVQRVNPTRCPLKPKTRNLWALLCFHLSNKQIPCRCVPHCIFVSVHFVSKMHHKVGDQAPECGVHFFFSLLTQEIDNNKNLKIAFTSIFGYF